MNNQQSKQDRGLLGFHWPRREKSSERGNQSEHENRRFPEFPWPRREKSGDRISASKKDKSVTKSPAIPPKHNLRQREGSRELELRLDCPKQTEKMLTPSKESGRKQTDLWSQAYSKLQGEDRKLLVAFKKYLLAPKSMWSDNALCFSG